MTDPSFQKTSVPQQDTVAQTIAPGDPENPATQVMSGASGPAAKQSQEAPEISGYQFVARLGEGGMGVVWKAVQLSTRREVAIKLLGGAFGSERILARFNREVELAARLSHPCICDVYDSGVQRGIHYYAMRLVQGQPLDVYVRKNNLSQRQILTLMRQAIAAVAYAHQKGVIHRDLKPSNILVGGDGAPAVLDFGLAKAMQDTDSRHAVSLDGEVSGTPAYMSPEQASGKMDAVDTRTDVYSLGVILFELLTGKKPHGDEGTIFQLMKRIIQDEPRRPRDLNPAIDRELEAILLKALAKKPEERYRSAGSLGEDLDNYFRGDPLQARPHTLGYFLKRWIGRYRWWVAMGAVLIALVIGIFVKVSAKIMYERRQAIDAQIGAEKEKEHAQLHFDQARAAVADLLDVSEEDLYSAPGFLPLRRRLLKTSIDCYRQFIEHDSRDPGPMAELARLYATYATALRTAPDGAPEALAALDSARLIQEELARNHPAQPAYRADLAWTLAMIGWISGDPHQANDVRRQSLALREKLLADNPNDPIAKADLAWSEWWLDYGDSGGDALRHRQRATELREQLVRQFPQSGEFRRDLANSYEYTAAAVEKMTPAVAFELQRKALALRLAVVDDLRKPFPEIFKPERGRDTEGHMLRLSMMWMERDLGQSHLALATMHEAKHRWTEALMNARKARDIFWRLTQQNPTVVDFVNGLDQASQLIVRSAAAGNQPNDARAEQSWETDMLGKLAAAHPEATDLQQKLDEIEKRNPATRPTDAAPATKP